MSSCIQTVTGMIFDLVDPQPEQIDLQTISVHLSRIPRWVGATQFAYSVAQHSVLMSQFCRYPLHALLHDAAEAYTGDLTRPYKRIVHGCKLIEEQIDVAVRKRFGLGWSRTIAEEVKACDETMLLVEARELLLPVPEWARGKCLVSPLDGPIQQWDEQRSAAEFRARFVELNAEAG